MGISYERLVTMCREEGYGVTVCDLDTGEIMQCSDFRHMLHDIIPCHIHYSDRSAGRHFRIADKWGNNYFYFVSRHDTARYIIRFTPGEMIGKECLIRERVSA